MGAFNLLQDGISLQRKPAQHQLRFILCHQCYDIWQIALIHYKPESMGAFGEFDLPPYGFLFQHAHVSVHRGRGSFAVSINYTEEGQSVGGPCTVLPLNNCLLRYMSVYGRATACSRTQSPNAPIAHYVCWLSVQDCIPKRKTEQSGQDWGW